jgi:rubrerythrin
MSSTAAVPQTSENIAILFQYTLEAYKVFQKLSEVLQNAFAAQSFTNFAADERGIRWLLDMRYRDFEAPTMQLTLAGDLRLQDMLEGDLNNREMLEMLIARETTMERTLREWASEPGAEKDQNLFRYVAATKRSHVAALERELALAAIFSEWLKREDAAHLIVHGDTAE